MPKATGDAFTHSPAAPHRCALGHEKRGKARDKRKAGHHHGAKTRMRTRYGRVDDRLARLAFSLGKLHGQDHVLCRRGQQHHQSDLGIDVERKPRHLECNDRGAMPESW
jgi:hypothetical protein